MNVSLCDGFIFKDIDGGVGESTPLFRVWGSFGVNVQQPAQTTGNRTPPPKPPPTQKIVAEDGY